MDSGILSALPQAGHLPVQASYLSFEQMNPLQMEKTTRIFNPTYGFQVLRSSLLICTNPARKLSATPPSRPKSSFPHAIACKVPLSGLLSVIRRQNYRRSRVHCCEAIPESRKWGKEEFIVVNFYHLVRIERPKEEVSKHESFLEGRDICGRIYINEQGINAQYSGPSQDALAYVDWLKEDDLFSDILVQVTHASSGHAFPRLKLRYKPSLVQMEGRISDLPLLDPGMRAVPLDPFAWRKLLQSVRNSASSNETNTSPRKILLLDVRNGYEWDVGHFRGAQRPDVDCFRRTSFGLSASECDCSDPLFGVDKENTDVMMYCTGGIRCDVYSTLLRQKGFTNLYTLKGGVSHFLEHAGPGEEWEGNLFVFDARLSLEPSVFKHDARKQKENSPERKCESAKCCLCGSLLIDFRHRNCANLDCNLLFLACNKCVEELSGCCSVECTSAQRLRPVLPGHQRYQKWHIYRDAKPSSTWLMAR